MFESPARSGGKRAAAHTGGTSRPVLQLMGYQAKLNWFDDGFRPARPAFPGAAHLTAHHKYPWEEIKKDILYAFEAEETARQSAFTKLEGWSGIAFPMDKAAFVRTPDDRETSYGANERVIDNWIQGVCWVPKNMFIGPKSDKREDDPSKRPPGLGIGGVDQADGHFTRPRSMSFHSLEHFSHVTSQGGFRNAASTIPATGPEGNNPSPYNPAEWVQDPISGLYHQINDKYYEKNIFNIDFNGHNQFKHVTAGQYNITIKTTEDITAVAIDYMDQDSTDSTNKTDTSVRGAMTVGASAEGKKDWTYSCPTPSKHRLHDFKYIPTRTTRKVFTAAVPVKSDLQIYRP